MKPRSQSDSADDGIREVPERAAPRRRFPVVLFLIFCCLHAVFLIVSIVPRRPGQDDPGNPVMDMYRLVTGGRQVWNMFETIPILHSLDLRLEAEDESGAKFTAGCVVPGFKPYPKPERSRYYVIFHRMLMTSPGVPFRDAYLRRAAQSMPGPIGGGAVRNPTLVANIEYTRNLVHIRRDGLLSLPSTQTLGLGSTMRKPE